jgi:hypothetical protein
LPFGRLADADLNALPLSFAVTISGAHNRASSVPSASIDRTAAPPGKRISRTTGFCDLAGPRRDPSLWRRLDHADCRRRTSAPNASDRPPLDPL